MSEEIVRRVSSFVVLALFSCCDPPPAPGERIDGRLASLPVGRPRIGEFLVHQYKCGECHDGAAAPAFKGVASRARTRVPGLSARQYLAESIDSPGRYLVPGYLDLMPRLRMGHQDLSDVLAYLMTLR